MVKKLKLDIHDLSKSGLHRTPNGGGFAQIVRTNVLGLVYDGLKSKKSDASFALQSVPNFDFFQNLSYTCLVPARPG